MFTARSTKFLWKLRVISKQLKFALDSHQNRTARPKAFFLAWFSPQIRYRNQWNFCLWNLEAQKILLLASGILGFGIRNTAQRIRNPSSSQSRIQLLLKKTGNGYWYLESTAWNPESKTVLDSLIWGDRYSFAIHHIGHTFCDFQSGTIFVFSLHYTIMKFLTRTRISGVACMGTKCRFAIM